METSIETDQLGSHRDDEDIVVQAWRVDQLQSLGLPQALAEVAARLVDWHEIAKLVKRGCAPELALEIVL
jgi:hypothetical protein